MNNLPPYKHRFSQQKPFGTKRKPIIIITLNLIYAQVENVCKTKNATYDRSEKEKWKKKKKWITLKRLECTNFVFMMCYNVVFITIIIYKSMPVIDTLKKVCKLCLQIFRMVGRVARAMYNRWLKCMAHGFSVPPFLP